MTQEMLQVFYRRGVQDILMGRLALKNRIIFFEYAPEFLETGLEVSPFKLPLKSGIIPCEDRVFDGLFGVFNDSLPDGWGRLLLDRKLIQLGINPGSLSPLDRLSYVGSHGMGALSYKPEFAEEFERQHDDLDIFASDIAHFQEQNDEQFVDELLALNGSSAGARPKIIVNGWLIKFRSATDLQDVGPIEYAYHLMAKAAGLDVPEAKLFPSKKGPGYFGVKRFDRTAMGWGHMHTVSGLLHADHRLPSLDYETIMKATLRLTKNGQECEKQFHRCVFNVLAHNRDDHAKNFSFLMDEAGVWRVSPAYDLTFSSGPAGEHCTMVMGEGKNPEASHLLKLAEISGIAKQTALQIIDQVQQAVSQWSSFAKAAHITKESSMMVGRVLL